MQSPPENENVCHLVAALLQSIVQSIQDESRDKEFTKSASGIPLSLSFHEQILQSKYIQIYFLDELDIVVEEFVQQEIDATVGIEVIMHLLYSNDVVLLVMYS